MKKLSIKMKITLWYTGLIVIIMAMVLSIILASSDKILLLNIQDQLEESVKEGFRDIDYENGHLEVDNDFEYYDDGVTLLIYDKNGALLEGNVPSGFNGDIPMNKDGLQTIEQNGQEWLLYDHPYKKFNDEIWIRGVYQLNQLSSAMNTILLVTLIAFPFLIIVAATGGYSITKRAFRPVQKMIDTVSEINDGQDLSKRIDLKGSNDEIHALAQTFDRMFDRLQSSFENEKQFTSDASHELRTPTSVIISQSEYALSQIDDSKEVKESLEVILKQSQKMSSLISQLLLLARVDQQNMDHFLFERLNISELTEMVAEELTYMAYKADIEIITDLEDNLFIKADQTLIMRLLMNLITNAVAYGRPGGYVKIKLYQQGNHVIGEISDNGIGISAEHINKIWDRFYRVDPSRTSTANGNTGLGLSIVKWIVSLHGGTIDVSSELDKGSTFKFRLPIGY
ncbi:MULTISPECIES: HAMP domain-containing histidine kinase [unclassified Bacillus (in: firmicutes)]|uniref:HAMP domain-containing histidine kinase n=1 Tax=unclassified Bacillus (in: firmicutes) TaxID=185979 RepID=UPI00080AD75D|nr:MULTISPECIES: HAMP domain-containing histidine kinase [unclassified Bacillus (in: firmicutes)]OCA89914.1 two-component sensor histidine kinase [Bacillus sp. FJAT-27986]